MRALLLAAGLGTRLRPITDLLPKCLVPIQGVPLLGWWLELLKKGGVEKVLINLHYHAPLVERFLRQSAYADFAETVYEPELLGTGGTLLRNRSFFEVNDGPLMLVHADNLSCFPVNDFALRHREAGKPLTMMTFATETPETCGILELDQAGVVRGFHEKVKNPPGNLANGAVYVFDGPDIFRRLTRAGGPFIDLSEQILPSYLGEAVTYHNQTYHRDIGSLAMYLAAHQDLSFPICMQPSPALIPWITSATDLTVDQFEKDLAQRLQDGLQAPVEHRPTYDPSYRPKSQVIVYGQVDPGFSVREHFLKTGSIAIPGVIAS